MMVKARPYFAYGKRHRITYVERYQAFNSYIISQTKLSKPGQIESAGYSKLGWNDDGSRLWLFGIPLHQGSCCLP